MHPPSVTATEDDRKGGDRLKGSPSVPAVMAKCPTDTGANDWRGAGRRELLWSIISETLNQADARIDASVVPYRIRRQAYRVLRSSSN
jgi:hypothetical protein